MNEPNRKRTKGVSQMAAEHLVHSEAHVMTLAKRHSCSVCDRAFRYRYDGAYRPATLQPIDFICQTCFPTWFQTWETTHDWA